MATCEDEGNTWEDGECILEESNVALVLGLILGIMGAASLGVLVYCFLCKKQDDDFNKV